MSALDRLISRISANDLAKIMVDTSAQSPTVRKVDVIEKFMVMQIQEAHNARARTAELEEAYQVLLDQLSQEKARRTEGYGYERSLTAKVQELERTIVQLKEEIEVIEEERVEAERNCDDLESEVTEKDNEIADLEHDLRASNREVEDLQNERDELMEETLSQSFEIRDLRGEVEELKQQLSVYEV